MLPRRGAPTNGVGVCEQPQARDQSESLRQSEADGYGVEEEDAELYESLARARRAAQQQHHLATAKLATLVDQVASRRTQEAEETPEEVCPPPRDSAISHKLQTMRVQIGTAGWVGMQIVGMVCKSQTFASTVTFLV